MSPVEPHHQRSRIPSPAVIVAVAALIVAMTGSAIAANKYLITSTSQISPKVLKKLHGAVGKPGTAGVDGADGADGVDGVDGAPGVDGVDGVDGAAGAPGAPGAAGAPAPPGADAGSSFTSRSTFSRTGTQFSTISGIAPSAASASVVDTVMASAAQKVRDGTVKLVSAAGVGTVSDLTVSLLVNGVPLAAASCNFNPQVVQQCTFPGGSTATVAASARVAWQVVPTGGVGATTFDLSMGFRTTVG